MSRNDTIGDCQMRNAFDFRHNSIDRVIWGKGEADSEGDAEDSDG